MGRVLTVQTVLYVNDGASLVASLRSFAGSLSVARRSGVDGPVTFAHGDASPEPLDALLVEQLHGIAAGAEFSYEYVYFNENTGSARGQNQLAASFPAAWHFVTNPDIVFGGSCLRELWRRTLEPRVGIAEARQLPMELARRYDQKTGATSWASGACSLVRGDLWREIGGYDDVSFFLHCDDVDMSWRVRLAGYDVVHVPTARVFHDKRVDSVDATPVTPAHEYFYSALGSYMMAQKWGNEADRVRVLKNMSGPSYDDVRREIDRRVREGRIPTRVNSADRVAEFSENGGFGKWRF